MVSSFRERHRTELRQAILDAAAETFARDGYDSVSLRAVAEAVGLSHGAIYGYFKDKDELFEALVEQSFDQLAAALRGLPGRRGDPVRFLKRAGRKYVEFGLNNPGAYEFAFILRRPPRKEQKPHLAYEYMRTAVQRCIDQKRFRIRNVDLASQAIWTAVHGVTAMLILRPQFPWARTKVLIGMVVDSAVDGLVVGARLTAPSRRTL
jgi:AcrR family transcriptional regulator